MIIGFTGSRKGMTGDQAAEVTRILLRATEGHHGDCIGADEQFHDLCLALEIPVVIHPPEDDTYRAFCQGAKLVMPPRPFLVRNRIIVDTCELLVGAPKDHRQPASLRGQGTWSTIVYARRVGRELRVVLP
jgi:hypothetical protein